MVRSPDIVFLDANILFSASYRAGARLRALWALPEARLVTSTYAVEEALRNLETLQQRADLTLLLRTVEVVSAGVPAEHPIFAKIRLPEKDRPILLAAIMIGATHLLTGDAQHFGQYYGKQFAGVLILSPTTYVRSIADRPKRDDQ